MSDIVISCENLGKQYTLFHQAQRGDGLRHVINDMVTAPMRWLKGAKQPDFKPATYEQFWALKDVCFEVKAGDVVGVVGRNGAGKSTLLKVISRIIEPTEGRLRIRGRVASLLEVGTGFHPELTGRENIFLNGAILGMKRAEIKRKFDEMVAFAEVDRFLDTPVKRYSSGMYVRLAFAVAAHLEPEILVVDEVLAVGDASFQRKCLQKIKQIATSEGRTVFLVSHQLATVQHLCRSGILLDAGRVIARGETHTVLEKYLATRTAGGKNYQRSSWARPIIQNVRLIDESGVDQSSIACGSPFTIEVEFDDLKGAGVAEPVLGIVINHATLGVVTGVNTRMTGFRTGTSAKSGTFSCVLDSLPLLPGQYSIDVWFGDGTGDVDMVPEALTFSVEATDVYGTGAPPMRHLGTIFARPKWKFHATKI